MTDIRCGQKADGTALIPDRQGAEYVPGIEAAGMAVGKEEAQCVAPDRFGLQDTDVFGNGWRGWLRAAAMTLNLR